MNDQNDLISRRAVLEICDTVYQDWLTLYDGGDTVAWNIESAIKRLPAVTPPERTGRWIDTENGDVCSECGYEPSTPYRNAGKLFGLYYCPNCGAHMVEDDK